MKRFLACLLAAGLFFGSSAYGGSPYGIKRDDQEKKPSPNSASMEGLMFFEAAENASEDMLAEVIPDEPVAKDDVTRKAGEGAPIKAEKKDD